MYSMDRDRDFIFIHVPKTGGGSIKNAILRGIDNNLLAYVEPCNGLTTSKYHALWTDYHSKLGHKEYSNSYKFTIVRNPWDRMVSLYHWRRHGTSDSVYKELLDSGNVVKRLDTGDLPHQSPRAGNKINLTFAEWIQTFGRHHMQGPDALEMLDQCQYFREQDMNTIIRYENLQCGFDQVCDDLGIPKEPLVNIHKTSHDHYSTYYTDELREFVGLLSRCDIAAFSYEFEEASTTER